MMDETKGKMLYEYFTKMTMFLQKPLDWHELPPLIQNAWCGVYLLAISEREKIGK